MKRMLYLGPELPTIQGYQWVHLPLIKEVTRAFDKEQFSTIHESTEIILTSKIATRLLFQLLREHSIQLEHTFYCVGKATRDQLIQFGNFPHHVALKESQDGLIELIGSSERKIFFWPHSSKSRRMLPDILTQTGHTLHEYILYDIITKNYAPTIKWELLDGIYFSSPSTVDAFYTLYPEIFVDLPKHIEIKTIGEPTYRHLLTKQKHVMTV